MGMWVSGRWWMDFIWMEVFVWGRTLLEGLHARFARMHIWPVIRFASNGRMGMWVFR